MYGVCIGMGYTGEKSQKKIEDPRYRRIIENGKKGCKIDHFFITLTWEDCIGTIFSSSILPCCRSVDLDGSKREIRCSCDKNWEKNMTICGHQKIRKNLMKMTDFS